jgi:Sec-independent protein translocase protein TatA
MSILELLVILLVALIVIKPERLPEIAYTVGRLLAKTQKLYQQFLKKYHSYL